MATQVQTQQEYYETYKNEVEALSSELTDFSDGSMHDIIAGSFSTAMNEVSELVLFEFSKTFFDLAVGADLELLATDHFGDNFARPPAIESTGECTFTRANDTAGDVAIVEGTIVKTEKDADGQEIRFSTVGDFIMVGLTIDIPLIAVDGGVDGNVGATKIIVIESTLSDPSLTVSNTDPMAGGEDELEDAEYRERIRDLIQALAGATEAAVRGAVLSVPGVAISALTTIERVVIDYDIGAGDILTGASFFRIPYPIIYVADAAGNSSAALIQAVNDTLVSVRAYGVKIEILGAVSQLMDWTASLTLNGSGPNFAELSNDLTKIKDSMKEYIDEALTVGDGFNKALANQYILGIWGPTGTDDLVTFSSSVPSGNIAVATNVKLIADTISII